MLDRAPQNFQGWALRACPHPCAPSLSPGQSPWIPGTPAAGHSRVQSPRGLCHTSTRPSPAVPAPRDSARSQETAAGAAEPVLPLGEGAPPPPARDRAACPSASTRLCGRTALRKPRSRRQKSLPQQSARPTPWGMETPLSSLNWVLHLCSFCSTRGGSQVLTWTLINHGKRRRTFQQFLYTAILFFFFL